MNNQNSINQQLKQLRDKKENLCLNTPQINPSKSNTVLRPKCPLSQQNYYILKDSLELNIQNPLVKLKQKRQKWKENKQLPEIIDTNKQDYTSLKDILQNIIKHEQSILDEDEQEKEFRILNKDFKSQNKLIQNPKDDGLDFILQHCTQTQSRTNKQVEDEILKEEYNSLEQKKIENTTPGTAHFNIKSLKFDNDFEQRRLSFDEPQVSIENRFQTPENVTDRNKSILMESIDQLQKCHSKRKFPSNNTSFQSSSCISNNHMSSQQSQPMYEMQRDNNSSRFFGQNKQQEQISYPEEEWIKKSQKQDLELKKIMVMLDEPEIKKAHLILPQQYQQDECDLPRQFQDQWYRVFEKQKKKEKKEQIKYWKVRESSNNSNKLRYK